MKGKSNLALYCTTVDTIHTIRQSYQQEEYLDNVGRLWWDVDLVTWLEWLCEQPQEQRPRSQSRPTAFWRPRGGLRGKFHRGTSVQ